MTDDEIRQAVLDTVVSDTNQKFWKRVNHWLEWAYNDAFQQVLNDPRVLEEQRSAKLLDERFYLAEGALHRAAKDASLVASAQTVTVNGWNYTLVRGGGVCLIQCYVQTPSEMTRPAKFREQHAAVNTFLRAPQLALGDVDPELFAVAKVNGVLIHGPVGREFTEDEQSLAFANFAVPDDTYTYWGLNIPVASIVAAFDERRAAHREPQRDIARPRLKSVPKRGGES
jgi:hypothetical protein